MAIGSEFPLKNCLIYFGISNKNEEKSLESFLSEWINEKNEASPPIVKLEISKSPKNSIMSFETQNSELFSEKFSKTQKKCKTTKSLMRVQTTTIMASSLKKKLSNFELFDVNENKEESVDLGVNSFNDSEVSKKRVGKTSKILMNNGEKDENVRIQIFFNFFFF